MGRLGWLLIALAACGRVRFDPVPVMAPPWSTPEPWSLSPRGDDPTLTGDLLEVYYNVGSVDLYVARRASTVDPWGTGSLVTELDVAASQSTPEVSPDGLTMYFGSGRAGTAGGLDIWITTRASRVDPWGAPMNVPELSSTAADHPGEPSADLLAFPLDSSRNGNGDDDMFLATRASVGDAWATPVALAALNVVGADDESPALSSDGLELYFDSNRGGSPDLYVARRATVDDAFDTAEPIVELDTDLGEYDPWISPDGHDLVFYSNRGGSSELWHATR